MSVIPKVTSKEAKMTSLENQTMPYKKLPAKNIISNIQLPVIIDPIDPKRISKKLTNSLTMSSAVKAGLVFLGTVGVYYLTKTTNILSYFGWGAKNLDSKDVNSGEIAKVKTIENSLNVKTNSGKIRRINNPSVNQITQNYKIGDSTVKFKEIEVKEFKDLPEIKEESVIKQRSSFRRSISVQNPIPDQNVTVGNLFELTIDGTNVFNSNRTLSLEATNIPAWLMLIPLNPNPTFKGSYATLEHVSGVIVSEDYAYVTTMFSGSPGLQIIDISNPVNPTFKGSYDTPDNAHDVVLSGNYAYVAADTSGLQIIDISDPANPTFKGSYSTGRANGVTLSGNYAYMTDGIYGLWIIDVTNPSKPTLKSLYDMSDNACDVVLSGNYAYVAKSSGLQSIDISDPSNPTFKGSYATLEHVSGVTVSGNYAYGANGYSGLQIIDISDPSNPTFKGSYDTSSYAYGVIISGNYAYVADWESGLLIIDISDPTNPTFKGSYDTLGFSEGVALSGNYAYVADGLYGLQIIALNSDKLTLLGTPNFVGTYGVDIKACNEIMECVTDSFYIIVKDSDDTTDTTSITDTSDLTTTSIIISLMTLAVCTACVASFSLPLIIGGGIVALRRHRNKILENNCNTKEKELKEAKKLEKSKVGKDKKIIVDKKVVQPIEKKIKVEEV